MAKTNQQIDLTQSDDDDDSGFTLIYSGSKSNISMSDIKNENNTNNNLGPDFGTYRQASIEEDEGMNRFKHFKIKHEYTIFNLK